MGGVLVKGPTFYPEGAPWLEWGVASEAITGETLSGDRYVVIPSESRALIGVIDGLGHGVRASAVAQTTLETLYAHYPQENASVVRLFQRCHEALRGSRGVVMSLALLDAEAQTSTWFGVGNVKGVMIHTNGRQPEVKSMFLRGGIVGYNLPTPRPIVTPLSPETMLILATDGLRSEFTHALPLAGGPQAIADHLFTEYHRGTDDALVLVVRYLSISKNK